MRAVAIQFASYCPPKRLMMRALPWILLLAICCGCAENKPKRRMRNTEETGAPMAVAPVKPVAKPSEKASLEAFAKYRSPFPEREDLFSPPNIEMAQKLAEISSAVPEVALKGIVDVHGLTAILVIEGKVSLVKVGQTERGVEVLAIENDRVTLQRNGRSWSTLLHEKRDQPVNIRASLRKPIEPTPAANTESDATPADASQPAGALPPNES